MYIYPYILADFSRENDYRLDIEEHRKRMWYYHFCRASMVGPTWHKDMTNAIYWHFSMRKRIDAKMIRLLFHKDVHTNKYCWSCDSTVVPVRNDSRVLYSLQLGTKHARGVPCVMSQHLWVRSQLMRKKRSWAWTSSFAELHKLQNTGQNRS